MHGKVHASDAIHEPARETPSAEPNDDGDVSRDAEGWAHRRDDQRHHVHGRGGPRPGSGRGGGQGLRRDRMPNHTHPYVHPCTYPSLHIS